VARVISVGGIATIPRVDRIEVDSDLVNVNIRLFAKLRSRPRLVP